MACQMRAKPAVCLALGLLLLLQSVAADKSNGFGTQLEWKSTEDMKDFYLGGNTKPIMYLFNQPWCGACNNLKTAFQGEAAAGIQALAKDFVMVNIGGDDNKLYESEYAPDGGYIPRILFAEPNGKLRPDIVKAGNPDKYKYYYSSAEEVVAGMTHAKQLLAQPEPAAAEEVVLEMEKQEAAPATCPFHKQKK